jgi:hypothetical protein
MFKRCSLDDTMIVEICFEKNLMIKSKEKNTGDFTIKMIEDMKGPF